jgi:hypothetical protein
LLVATVTVEVPVPPGAEIFSDVGLGAKENVGRAETSVTGAEVLFE